MTKSETGFVKITGGIFSGRKIRTPGGETHPMGERERVALFNMIADRIKGTWVLDLYAGGGTLGLEAMSRGAAYVMMIEKDYSAVLTAADNMEELGLLVTESKVAHGDVLKLTKGLKEEGVTSQYGLVFVDPPYNEYSEDKVSYLGDAVAEGGTLVLSHPKDTDAPEIDGLVLEKSKQYAGANISIYKKPGELADYEGIAAMQAGLLNRAMRRRTKRR